MILNDPNDPNFNSLKFKLWIRPDSGYLDHPLDGIREACLAKSEIQILNLGYKINFIKFKTFQSFCNTNFGTPAKPLGTSLGKKMKTLQWLTALLPEGSSQKALLRRTISPKTLEFKAWAQRVQQGDDCKVPNLTKHCNPLKAGLTKETLAKEGLT